LVVLAAGIGSRYGGWKQIEPMGPHSEIIMDYSVFDGLNAGFGGLVFVINPAMESAVRRQIGARYEPYCPVSYVAQRLELPEGWQVPPDRVKPWGTAHALLSCRGQIHTPFAAINADDLYGRSGFQTLSDYLSQACDRDGVLDCCMVGYPVENTLSEHGHVARGVCQVDVDGRLIEIQERTRVRPLADAAEYSEDGENWIPIPRGTLVSMNLWGFTPGILAELDERFSRFLRKNRQNLSKAELYLPAVVGDLVQEGRARVQVLPARDRWFGVTYPADRPEVQQAIRDLIAQGVYPAALWAEERPS
jgi:hypothetical protein